MTYLGPVELDVFGLHRSHAVAEVVADTDRVGIRFEVVHGYRDVEIGREEEPKPSRDGLHISLPLSCVGREITHNKACDMLGDDSRTAGAI